MARNVLLAPNTQENEYKRIISAIEVLQYNRSNDKEGPRASKKRKETRERGLWGDEAEGKEWKEERISPRRHDGLATSERL